MCIFFLESCNVLVTCNETKMVTLKKEKEKKINKKDFSLIQEKLVFVSERREKRLYLCTLMIIILLNPSNTVPKYCSLIEVGILPDLYGEQSEKELRHFVHILQKNWWPLKTALEINRR